MIFWAILLGIIPGLIWLFFYLQEDPHPEPKSMIFMTFVVGGLMSVPVIIFQLWANDILTFFNIGSGAIIFIVVMALIEEIFKFLAAFWITYKNPEFDEAIDAMIYTVTAALGFATLENVLYLGNTDSLSMAFSTVALRFIGATLLHALASGILGYYWAKGIIKKSAFINIIYGLLGAGFVHSLFNLLIKQYQLVNFIYPSLFLILVAVFVLTDFDKLRKVV